MNWWACCTQLSSVVIGSLSHCFPAKKKLQQEINEIISACSRTLACECWPSFQETRHDWKKYISAVAYVSCSLFTKRFNSREIIRVNWEHFTAVASPFFWALKLFSFHSPQAVLKVRPSGSFIAVVWFRTEESTWHYCHTDVRAQHFIRADLELMLTTKGEYEETRGLWWRGGRGNNKQLPQRQTAQVDY